VKPSASSVVQFGAKIGVTLVGFLATLLFARELSQATLGTYFLAIAVLSWLEFGSEFGLSTATTKRISERTAPAAYLVAAVLLRALILAVVVGAMLLARPLLNDYLGRDLALFLVVMLVAKSAYFLAITALRGQHRVATAAGLELGGQGTRALAQSALVVLGVGLVGLFVGYIAAFTLVAVVGGALLVRHHGVTTPSREHFERLLAFMQYSWLRTLKTRTSAWMDTIVLGFFVSNSLIAVYEISWNIAVVFALASQSIATALFPTLSEQASDESIETVRSILDDGMVFAGVLSIPGVVGAALLGPEVLRLYGPEYTIGSTVLALLAFSALFSSYEGILQTALDAVNRPDLSFRANLLYITANVVGNVVLVWQFGMVGAAVATASAMGLSLAYSFYALRTTIDVTVPVGELARQTIATAAMAGVVLAVEPLVAGFPYYYVLAVIGAGAATYAVTLVALSGRVRDHLRDVLAEFRRAVADYST
jgi:O-antigen/teichoic acid export membrane protein